MSDSSKLGPLELAGLIGQKNTCVPLVDMSDWLYQFCFSNLFGNGSEVLLMLSPDCGGCFDDSGECHEDTAIPEELRTRWSMWPIVESGVEFDHECIDEVVEFIESSGARAYEFTAGFLINGIDATKEDFLRAVKAFTKPT